MLTSTSSITQQVRATDVRLESDILTVVLSDSREISIHIDKVEWLRWLAQASPEERAKWSIEPGGFAIYWEDLDDGIELVHLLGRQEVL
jgi:uncharacterized protein DUF2442